MVIEFADDEPKKPVSDLVNEARELLSKTTPGPWAVWDSCSWRRIGTQQPFADGNVVCPITQNDGHPDLLAKREDLELIAAAPTLLSALCNELDQQVSLNKVQAENIVTLQEQMKAWRSALESITRLAGNLTDEAVQEVGGINEGRSRALMILAARQIAQHALTPKGEQSS